MKIKFSPQRCDSVLVVEVQGDILHLNGEAFDFSPLQEGQLLPHSAIVSDFICGDIERIDGHIVVTLILPHGADATEAQRFPEDMIINSNGKVDLPE